MKTEVKEEKRYGKVSGYKVTMMLKGKEFILEANYNQAPLFFSVFYQGPDNKFVHQMWESVYVNNTTYTDELEQMKRALANHVRKSAR